MRILEVNGLTTYEGRRSPENELYGQTMIIKYHYGRVSTTLSKGYLPLHKQLVIVLWAIKTIWGHRNPNWKHERKHPIKLEYVKLADAFCYRLYTPKGNWDECRTCLKVSMNGLAEPFSHVLLTDLIDLTDLICQEDTLNRIISGEMPDRHLRNITVEDITPTE